MEFNSIRNQYYNS